MKEKSEIENGKVKAPSPLNKQSSPKYFQNREALMHKAYLGQTPSFAKEHKTKKRSSSVHVNAHHPFGEDTLPHIGPNSVTRTWHNAR